MTVHDLERLWTLTTVEHLTDAESARVLGVSTSTIWQWRQRAGITRANFFARRFDARYGDGALATFRRLYDAGATYATIAAAFCISRQRVHQIARVLNLPARRATHGETSCRTVRAAEPSGLTA